jgi:hypothetical protein
VRHVSALAAFGTATLPGVNAGRVAVVERGGQVLAGLLVVLAGLGWSIAWALASSTFSFYGYMGDCGAPAVDAVSTSHDPLAGHCQHLGLLHVAIGVVIGALIAWGGLLVLLDAMAPDHSAGTRPPRRRLVMSAFSAVALVLLTVTITGTVAHASGSRTPTQAVHNDDGFGPPSAPS